MSNVTRIQLAAAVLVASVSFAAKADIGFESGSTAGYTITAGNGTITALSTDTVSFDLANFGFDYTGNVGPSVGSFFGKLTTSDTLGSAPLATVLEYTYATPSQTANDKLLVRLVTPDIGFDGTAVGATPVDDAFTVNLFDQFGAAYFTRTFKGSDLNTLTGGNFPDSGWISLNVAQNTSKLTISLVNGGDEFNAPALYVDYFRAPVVVAIPEAGSVAMSLAGLGIVGCFVAARRRRAA